MRKSDNTLESVKIFVEDTLTFERFTSSSWLQVLHVIIEKTDYDSE